MAGTLVGTGQARAHVAAAIDAFRADPEMARFDTVQDIGGCWETAQRFAWYCSQLGIPYLFRKWRLPPEFRTRYQHNVEVDGVIVCWTHRQIDPGAAWPHLERFAAYRLRFGAPRPICIRCGNRPHRGSSRCPGISRDIWDSLGMARPTSTSIGRQAAEALWDYLGMARRP